MQTFKHFVDNPVHALSYGYEAWLLDYWALWANWFSLKTLIHLKGEWKALFTQYSMVEFPLQFTLLFFGTLVFFSMPLTFWIGGTLSYFILPRIARNQKAERERSCCQR